MRKSEIEVGQRLAYCHPGWDRDHFAARQVEVLETGVRTKVPSYVWGRGSVTGTRVRFIETNREEVVNNVHLWMSWDEYRPLKAQHTESLREKEERRKTFRLKKDMENVEIAEALSRVGMLNRGRVNLDTNHDALLALAREVNKS